MEVMNIPKRHKLNKQVVVVCLGCSKEYLVKPSRLPKTKYCSLHCRASQKRQDTRYCAVEECSGLHYSLGYCQLHYTRFKVTGDPLKKKKAGHSTHGMSYTKEYKAYRSMLDRCYREKNAKYNLYGGRGIKVCREWRDSFLTFFDDMGYAPTPKHSLDRINNDGDYEPNNCRWATDSQQNLNRRKPDKY